MNAKNSQLEIIAFNIAVCEIAQTAGASRIELCDNPADGGTTPSYGLIQAAREILHIDLYVMVRPRGGDFLYSESEFEIMQADVEMCRELGCNGVVIGLLKFDGSVDKERTRTLVELAQPMGVTFHRAFDRTRDPLQALEDIIETGCERILTSGQLPNCLDGSSLIAELRKQADGRIIIMPGSGLKSSNIIDVARATGATEFHASARTVAKSGMSFVVPAMNEDLQTVTVDGNEVKKMAELLRQYQRALGRAPDRTGVLR